MLTILRFIYIYKHKAINTIRVTTRKEGGEILFVSMLHSAKARQRGLGNAS